MLKRTTQVVMVLLLLTGCSKSGLLENNQGLSVDIAKGEILPSNLEAQTEPGKETQQESEVDSWEDYYLAYLDETVLPDSYYTYDFIYVDDDDIPELVLNSGYEAGGCIILTCHEGYVDELQTNRLSFSYIERQNLLNNRGGHQGYYFDHIYKIVDGKWEKVFSGEYWSDDPTSLVYDEKMGRHHTEHYSIDDVETDEESYLAKVAEIYDSTQANTSEADLIIDEMYSYLKAGAYISKNHRYEFILDDCTWLAAQEMCRNKGGYLATITCLDEMEKIEKMIQDEGMKDVCFYIGARRGAETTDEYPRLGILWDDSSLIDPTCIGKWKRDEPSYSGITSNVVEVREDFVAIEQDHEINKFLFEDVTNDLVKYYPEYSGKLGYICEYDDTAPSEKNNNLTFLYSLEGLSADEIVDECNIYLDNTLNSNQPDTDYEKAFRIKPMSSEDSENGNDAVYYRFIPVYGTTFNCNPGLDLIKRIDVSRGSGAVNPEMSEYDDWKRMSVRIDLDIQDRDKAIQIYEKLYDQLAPFYENSFEIRDDMFWTSSGGFWNEDNSLRLQVQLVCLTEHDDSYSISVTKWHNVE